MLLLLLPVLVEVLIAVGSLDRNLVDRAPSSQAPHAPTTSILYARLHTGSAPGDP